MDPVITALKGKGPLNLVHRFGKILANYGTTARRQAEALHRLFDRLADLDCPATFPVVATVLQRNARSLRAYPSQSLEFAIHGFAHVDYTQLSKEEQFTHLVKAKQIFKTLGITPKGFRAPYLRANADTMAVLQQQGFLYDSSQGLSWDVMHGHDTSSYLRALSFYDAKSAEILPSLPSFEGSLVRIPYSLPDDEALIQRLGLQVVRDISAIWQTILHRTYQLEEVFTLGIHPERTDWCLASLGDVLAEARQLSPRVWIANLEEIACWWRDRYAAQVQVSDRDNGAIYITLDAPQGTAVLLRSVESKVSSTPWIGEYHYTTANALTVRAPVRPFVAVAPETAPALTSFLKQQGYIVEVSSNATEYAYYFDQADFDAMQQRAIVKLIEETSRPLVRLGRWPAGARSALCITGDIDALTLWDYASRAFGK